MSINGPLIRALGTGDEAPRITLRVGTVTDDTPVEVNIGGVDGIPASRCVGYVPIIGHTVLIAQQDNDSVIIIDRIVSGG